MTDEYMRHNYSGKQLSRNTNERKNLIRNLLRSLILHGAIKTSKAKAKVAQVQVEKLITKAKKGTVADVRNVTSETGDRTITKQLVDMAQTRFSARTSGYTRIVKLGKQRGDATDIVLLSFVDEKVEQEVIKPEKKSKEKPEETKKSGKITKQKTVPSKK
jgi:large subunit ribosomal protein L17